MKRSFLLVLSLLILAACATTPSAPSVAGVITDIEGQTLTITPAGGGQASSVTIGWGTRVVQPNGLEDNTAVLSVGMPVKVWLENDQTAGRIEIGQ